MDLTFLIAEQERALADVIESLVNDDDERAVVLYKQSQQQLECFVQALAPQPIHRTVWVNPRSGRFWENVVPKMTERDFKECFKMEKRLFTEIVKKLPQMERKNTNFRESIPKEKRVAIALYTLVSSLDYGPIAQLFGVSRSSVCLIFKEFCKAVWKELSPEYLSSQFLTQSKVEECVEGFNDIGFPQCFGVVDRYHIEIKSSQSDTLVFCNTNFWSSIVLLALVDYKSCFTYINVGAPGRCNESQIYEISKLKKMVNTTHLFQLNARMINGIEVPVVLIGNSAYPLSSTMMTPYVFSTEGSAEQKYFNDRILKAMRVSKNAFEQLKGRFRRLNKGLVNGVGQSKIIIKCCCVLHNFLNDNDSIYEDSWTLETASQKPQPVSEVFSGDQFENDAEEIRKAFSESFRDSHSTEFDIEEPIDVI